MDLSPIKSDADLLKRVLEAAGVERWLGADHRQCRCPFHDDRHPSAGIHRAQGRSTWLFTCNGCQVSGDVIRVVALCNNRTDAEVLRHLNETGELMGGVRTTDYRPSKRPQREEEPEYEKMAAEVAHHQAAATDEWLAETAKDLGVTAESLRRFGWGHYAGIGCAAAPMYDARGRVSGIRYRWASGPDGKPQKRSRTGSRSGLFQPFEAPPATRVLWVAEGATDPLALDSLGFWAVGLPAARQGIDLLDAYVKQHRPEAVIVMADANAAGRASATLCARAVLPRVKSAKTVEPPDLCGDVRSWVKAGRESGVSDRNLRRTLLSRTRATQTSQPKKLKPVQPSEAAANEPDRIWMVI